MVPAASPVRTLPSAPHRKASANPPRDPLAQNKPAPAASPEPPPPPHSNPSSSRSQFTRFLVAEHLNRSHPLQPLSIHHGRAKRRIAPEHIRPHRHRSRTCSRRRAV